MFLKFNTIANIYFKTGHKKALLPRDRKAANLCQRFVYGLLVDRNGDSEQSELDQVL